MTTFVRTSVTAATAVAVAGAMMATMATPANSSDVRPGTSALTQSKGAASASHLSSKRRDTQREPGHRFRKAQLGVDPTANRAAFVGEFRVPRLPAALRDDIAAFASRQSARSGGRKFHLLNRSAIRLSAVSKGRAVASCDVKHDVLLTKGFITARANSSARFFEMCKVEGAAARRVAAAFQKHPRMKIRSTTKLRVRLFAGKSKRARAQAVKVFRATRPATPFRFRDLAGVPVGRSSSAPTTSWGASKVDGRMDSRAACSDMGNAECSTNGYDSQPLWHWTWATCLGTGNLWDAGYAIPGAGNAGQRNIEWEPQQNGQIFVSTGVGNYPTVTPLGMYSEYADPGSDLQAYKLGQWGNRQSETMEKIETAGFGESIPPPATGGTAYLSWDKVQFPAPNTSTPVYQGTQCGRSDDGGVTGGALYDVSWNGKTEGQLELFMRVQAIGSNAVAVNYKDAADSYILCSPPGLDSGYPYAPQKGSLFQARFVCHPGPEATPDAQSPIFRSWTTTTTPCPQSDTSVYNPANGPECIQLSWWKPGNENPSASFWSDNGSPVESYNVVCYNSAFQDIASATGLPPTAAETTVSLPAFGVGSAFCEIQAKLSNGTLTPWGQYGAGPSATSTASVELVLNG